MTKRKINIVRKYGNKDIEKLMEFVVANILNSLELKDNYSNEENLCRDKYKKVEASVMSRGECHETSQKHG